MRATVLTLFPEVFTPHLTTSILGRAAQTNTLAVQLVNIRDYASDAYRTVDDTPYGGGAGMVLKVEPIDAALAATAGPAVPPQKRTVVLSARGEQFTQAKAAEYAALQELVLICGRYEGIDQRVVEHLADEEVAIGPYVLAGGELAALVIMETVARLLPGVLGNPDSLRDESFTTDTRREWPQYTKPAEYKGWTVPEVLLSGDHEAIRRWREEQQGQ